MTQVSNEERQALLEWYDAHRRDLPWRRTKDPYAIWVSEVMLQQTRVDTVIPFFERFLARFPDAAALARADEDEVLSHWSGLGYYRRARLLHAGARAVVADHAGRVPEDPGARRALPGVGRYTAGAIGSIAFDRPEPIVDGNVARVLARRLLIETPLGAKETEAQLWAAAEALAAGPRPGDLNQALMELGATRCTPKAPRCDGCPWAPACRARAAGRALELPVPKPKRSPKRVHLTALVVRRRDEVWLIRRPRDEGLFAGLWLPPMVETAPAQLSLGATDSDRDATLPPPGRPAAARALVDSGLTGRPKPGSRRIQHLLTHRRFTVDVMTASHGRRATKAPHAPERRAFTLAELGAVGVPELTLKILEAARVIERRGR